VATLSAKRRTKVRIYVLRINAKGVGENRLFFSLDMFRVNEDPLSQSFNLSIPNSLLFKDEAIQEAALQLFINKYLSGGEEIHNVNIVEGDNDKRSVTLQTISET
jgi:hypothetical protein